MADWHILQLTVSEKKEIYFFVQVTANIVVLNDRRCYARVLVHMPNLNPMTLALEKQPLCLF